MRFRWWVNVAPSMPSSSAISRCDWCNPPFNDASTSQVANEPSASASTASNARLSSRARRVTNRPIGSEFSDMA